MGGFLACEMFAHKFCISAIYVQKNNRIRNIFPEKAF